MLRFTFRGKSGVEHSIAVADPRLARIIQRCQDLPGQELFQYLDAKPASASLISSDDVNAYLREITGRDVTREGLPHLGRHHARGGGAAPARRRREPARGRPQRPRAPSTPSPSASATRAPCAASTTSIRRSSSAYLMGDTVPLPSRRRRAKRARSAAPRCAATRSLVLQFLQERL